MMRLLVLLFLVACGDGAPPPPDAFVDYSCNANASYEPISCELAPPLPACAETFVQDGQRGCCVVGQFYHCK